MKTNRKRLLEELNNSKTKQAGLGILLVGKETRELVDEIAGSVGGEVYRVDLRKVLSKHIGETEKNLNRVFDRAEARDAVLFLDEADGLFGKRSEVKDAHDRYVLKKIEDSAGITIIATKGRQEIDAAFRRRLRFLPETR